MIDPSDGSAVTSGDQITGNVIQTFVDYGVVLAYNAYGDVTSNTIIMPDNAEAGVWVYDFTANGVTPATSTINVSQNNITAGQDDFGGIWANLDYAPTATLNVTDNTVNAGTSVTGADGYTNGIYLSSIQNGFSVNLTGNTVGSSGGQFATGISLWNLPTSNTVTVSNGSVGNSVVGIEVDNDDINFGPGAATTVGISGVSITGATTGILVSGDSLGGGTISADISDNNITGDTTGIEVSGPNASATISGNAIDDPTTGILVSGGSASITGNDIYHNTTGIEFTGGGSGSVTNNDFDHATAGPANGTDLLIDSTAGSVTIGDGNAFAGTYSIENQSSQPFDLSSYTHTTFDAVNLTSATLSQLYGIEDSIVDAIDVSGYGLVRLEAGEIYVTPNSFFVSGGTNDDSGSLQRAIDAASPGDTINVEGGEYALTGGLSIAKGLTIQGPYASVNPNTYIGPTITQADVDGGVSTQLLLISTTAPVSLEGLQFNHMLIQSYTTASQISFTDNTFSDIAAENDGGNDLFFANSATFDFNDNAITSDDTGGSGSQIPDFVQIAGNWDGSSGTQVQIEGNVEKNVLVTGFNLSDVAGTVSGNTFDGIDAYAILLANDQSTVVSGNYFTSIVNPALPAPTLSEDTWGAGVRFYTPGGANYSATISGNQFTDNYVGIGVRYGSDLTGLTTVISGNTFTGNTYDIMDQGTSTSTLSPTGDNVFDGVALSSANTGVSMQSRTRSSTPSTCPATAWCGCKLARFTSRRIASSHSAARLRPAFSAALTRLRPAIRSTSKTARIAAWSTSTNS